MNGCSLKRAMMKPLKKTDRDAHRQRHDDRGRERHMRLQSRRQEAREGEDRSDRKIDAAGQDDDQHAEAEKAVGDQLAGDADEVALGQEHLRGSCSPR